MFLKSERLRIWRERALIAIGGFLAVGSYAEAYVLLTDRKEGNLWATLTFVLGTVAFFLLVPRRNFIFMCTLGLLFFLGLLGMIVHWSLLPLPLVLICATLWFTLIKIKGNEMFKK